MVAVKANSMDALSRAIRMIQAKIRGRRMTVREKHLLIVESRSPITQAERTAVLEQAAEAGGVEADQERAAGVFAEWRRGLESGELSVRPRSPSQSRR